MLYFRFEGKWSRSWTYWEIFWRCFSFNYNREVYIVLYLWLRRSQGRNCMWGWKWIGISPLVSEFTIKLSRGKLKLPPINLYDLAQYYYAFFKARNPKCCTKIFLAAFQETHEYTGYTFLQIDEINRRLCNCFFKAFVKRSTDDANAQKFKEQRETKRRRLSSLWCIFIATHLKDIYFGCSISFDIHDLIFQN